ncbi:hypothetical protein EDD53_1791 [Pacificibacter maritimus]|uniref:Uncharacterized protein n=1 Tax=Pacificibacter maritimus TaxID=762213 RepID=A0A3N4V368_9RHOB|nr:hypothetical protein [Pacificibacter maritimus]RPE67384.1 hypothetical protein EDD53_1791 [Pacificibacter maritimus]
MSVLSNILNVAAKRPVWIHALGAAATFVVFGQVQAHLNASYEASNHPVDYMTGQTGFDAVLIKGYYAHMEHLGTLGVYLQTQFIDFGFIIMMALMGIMFGTLVARLGGQGSWRYRFGVAAAVSVVCGAMCDAFENLVSFVMLANPTSFADWLALPYSTFAVIKFGLIALGLLLVILSAVIGAGERGLALIANKRGVAKA